MPDMLVNLLNLAPAEPLVAALATEGIQIRRALAPDKHLILDWVTQHAGTPAAGECEVAFSRIPVSCFIATRKREILGFACYEATARNFFGPTEVLETEQGKGIGKVLLIRSLQAMRDEGYVYAIIGGVGPAEFYAKSVGAVPIDNSTPGIYRDFLGGTDG
ncbi:MAG: GNAT family N-acetyltransferase [Sphaerochaetaceae bacterium]